MIRFDNPKTIHINDLIDKLWEIKKEHGNLLCTVIDFTMPSGVDLLRHVYPFAVRNPEDPNLVDKFLVLGNFDPTQVPYDVSEDIAAIRKACDDCDPYSENQSNEMPPYINEDEEDDELL